MNPKYTIVARRAGHRCEYCRAPEVAFNFPFEVEHVTPVSLNGTDELSNLALACRACNIRKGDSEFGVDESTGETVHLFHPRTSRWTEHFALDQDSCELTGLTPSGRATIAILDLNHPLQVAARELWRKLRIFP